MKNLRFARRRAVSRVGILTLFMLSVAIATGCNREAARPAPKPLPTCPSIPTEGMRLWLRADAGVTTDETGAVSEWKDQSSEHNDFLQKTPANRPVRAIAVGRHVVRFTERKSSLFNESLTGPMDEFTVAIVLTPSAFDGNSQYFGARDWSQFLFCGGPDGAMYAGTSLGSRMDANEALPKGLLVKNERQRYLFMRSGGVARLYKDGKEIASRPSDPPAPWTGFQIGHDNDISIFRGDVAELLVYRRALTPADLAQVETYLRVKYWDLPGCVSASASLAVP
jgi:hypothetical protein